LLQLTQNDSKSSQAASSRVPGNLSIMPAEHNWENGDLAGLIGGEAA
jgi:hypothetical protein